MYDQADLKNDAPERNSRPVKLLAECQWTAIDMLVVRNSLHSQIARLIQERLIGTHQRNDEAGPHVAEGVSSVVSQLTNLRLKSFISRNPEIWPAS